MTYVLRSEDGTEQLSINSTPVGDFHQISVDNFASTLDPGWYQFVGYATSGTERHQIYLAGLLLEPNSGSNAQTTPTVSFYQQMIDAIQGQLLRLTAHELDDSNVQQSELRRVKRLELEKQLAINQEKRNNELQLEAIRNGKPSGARVIPRFNIIGA